MKFNGKMTDNKGETKSLIKLFSEKMGIHKVANNASKGLATYFFVVGLLSAHRFFPLNLFIFRVS